MARKSKAAEGVRVVFSTRIGPEIVAALRKLAETDRRTLAAELAWLVMAEVERRREAKAGRP